MTSRRRRWWYWEGERLAPPLTVARRLLAYPVFQMLRVLMCITVAAGWGVSDALDCWRSTR